MSLSLEIIPAFLGHHKMTGFVPSQPHRAYHSLLQQFYPRKVPKLARKIHQVAQTERVQNQTN